MQENPNLSIAQEVTPLTQVEMVLNVKCEINRASED